MGAGLGRGGESRAGPRVTVWWQLGLPTKWAAFKVQATLEILNGR